MNLLKTFESDFKEDVQAVHEFVDGIYQDRFAALLDPIREMKARLQKAQQPVSDTDLEWILTDLPMNLFTVAEGINQLRLELELMKLKRKEIIHDMEQDIRRRVLETEGSEPSAAAVKAEVAIRVVDHDVLIQAYESVITRVENELSYSRELIMGSKKIFDARRRAEGAMPVGEDDYSAPQLPDYEDVSKNTKAHRR